MRIPAFIHTYVLDPFERAASTFVEQFVVIIAPTGVLAATQHWSAALLSAGLAAAFSLVTSVATFWVAKLNPGTDLILRVVKTFGQSFLGTLVAGGILNTPGGWKAALAAAFPVAALATLKGLGSLGAFWSEGASLLPLAASVYQKFSPEIQATLGGPSGAHSASAPPAAPAPVAADPVVAAPIPTAPTA